MNDELNSPSGHFENFLFLFSSFPFVRIKLIRCVLLLSGYMAGKIFMSMVVARFNSEIAFSLVYIYSAELFPTTVRYEKL